MTTIARRPADQIRRDIAKFEAWQTVQAGANFAAWVQGRLNATKQELAACMKGSNR